MTPQTGAARVADIAARCKAARNMVADLCNRRREWLMSIPARPDYDPDIVIAASLDDIPWLLAEVERLHAAEGRMREALEPFAKAAAGFAAYRWDGVENDVVDASFTIGDLRRAAAILAQTPDGERK